jgi:hypothetical protein
MPASTVPAVYVQLFADRIVPTRVSVPNVLLKTTIGSAPAAVVAAPVKVCAPGPLTRRVAVPPVVVEAWLIAPWAARVPVPLRLPAVRVREPAAVRVVPAAIEVVVRTSTLLSVCEPVIVPPEKRTVEVPGSRVPAV